MRTVKSFHDLEVYQRASDLFPTVYKTVRSWSALDQRELGSQMIRAANSIHANIAEGFTKTPNDFKRFLGIAIGSCNELMSHIIDAHRIQLIGEKDKIKLLHEYNIVVKQLVRLKQNWH